MRDSRTALPAWLVEDIYLDEVLARKEI